MKRILTLSLVAVVLIATCAACDTSKLGQTHETVALRTYADRFGQIVVNDGPPNGYDACGVGITLAGVAIVFAAATPPPADAVVLIGGWTLGVLGLAASTADCWYSWGDTVMYDAYARWLFTCASNNGSIISWPDAAIALDNCVVMGWAASAVEATMSIVDAAVKKVTACQVLVPLAVYINGQWGIIRICADQ